MAVQVVGVPFRAHDPDRDFCLMAKDPKYADAVLVFNDNVLDSNATTPFDGAGSAAIRTLSCKYGAKDWRAAGVPTGWSSATGGFRADSQGNLEPFAARAIVLAIERIVLSVLASEGRKTRIIFSCLPNDATKIGSGIFVLPAALVDYISVRLLDLPRRIALKDTKFTLERIEELERQVAYVAHLQNQLAVPRDPFPSNKRTRDQETTQFAQAKKCAPRTIVMSAALDATDALVVKQKSLTASDEARLGLYFVGRMQSGAFVYERANVGVLRAAPSPYFL